MPPWLYDFAIVSLVTAGIYFIIIALDLFTKNPQQMWIMQVVWPVTALSLLCHFGRTQSPKQFRGFNFHVLSTNFTFC